MSNKESQTNNEQPREGRRLSKKNAPPSAPNIDLPREESLNELSVAEKIERSKATTEPKHRSELPKR